MTQPVSIVSIVRVIVLVGVGCVTRGDMDAQEIQGYLYTYTRMAGSNGGRYELSLRPATVSRTGDRAFYANHAGSLRHCTCNANPSCAGATAAANPIQQTPTNC